MKPLRLALLAVLAALVSAGCGEDEPSPSTPERSASAGASGMTVHAEGRVLDDRRWQKTVRPGAGDVVEYRVALFNTSGTQLRDVRVAVDLPKGMEPVLASDRVKDVTVHVANSRPLHAGLTSADGILLTPFARGETRHIFVRGRVKKAPAGNRSTRISVKTNEGKQQARVAVAPPA